MVKIFVTVLMLVLSAVAVARDAAPAVSDPALEARVNALASELRCLVCQNQTIADSSAGLAIDLKNQVREKMRQGESDAQIVQFMVQRYGDFVLYRPPVKIATMLLWFGPALLVLAGLLVLYRKLRVQASTDDPALTLEEHERASRLLAPDNQGKAA